MRKIDYLLIILITLLGIGLRLYHLELPKSEVFDEVYYAKAAQTYLNGQVDPNNGHPPLGKMLIALGIKLTPGQNQQFSWRFASLVFGSLMIPMVYLTGLLLTGSTMVGALSAFFLALDFLQLIQSRIAMLDIFTAFFSLMGFLLLWLYLRLPNSKKAWLLLSALTFGLAMASKGNGVFAALGAILCLWLMPREYSKPTIKETLTFSSIAVLTYILAFLPWFFKGVSLTEVFTYHKDLLHFRYFESFKHNYLSYFWQWPTLIRPIWYYYQENQGMVNGIFALGSPIFWWSFLLFLPWLIFWAWQRNQPAYRFVLIAYLSQYLLWAVAFKGAFFYYILPAVPWMAIAMAMLCRQIWLGRIWQKSLVIIFIGWVIFCFGLYYPLLIALPVSKDYYSKLIFLKNWI